MKKFSSTQIKLLNCLADGMCHNGNDLGVLLSMSRTAVWKRITQLIKLGLPIARIPQRGYRLAMPITFLNENHIRHQLKINHFNKPIDIHLFASVDSTNRLLKELPHNPSIDICCAEIQTAGRGRFGRQWYSPFGENIYLSSRWRFDCDLSRLSGLSLVVSLAILATLNDFGFNENIRVKWPNDILWNNKKLCGTLIEVIAESNSSAEVVIGIGLNVNSKLPITDESNNAYPDKPWCSLYDITGKYTDRNLLIAQLIIYLDQFLDKFMLQGFAAFMPRWHEIDYLQGNVITVSNFAGPLKGLANGVNETGQLILIDAEGTTHYLSSGDTSLHSMR
jgi:BirA family biotin operon repressor/biotin-[acetyl-CoA-carboxylase] ligase